MISLTCNQTHNQRVHLLEATQMRHDNIKHNGYFHFECPIKIILLTKLLKKGDF